MNTKARVFSTAATICVLAASSAVQLQSDNPAAQLNFANATFDRSATTLEYANDRDVVRTSSHDDATATALTINAGDASIAPGADLSYGFTQAEQAYGPPASKSADPADDEQPAAVSPFDKMSGAVAALATSGSNGLVDIVVRYDQHPALFDDAELESLGGVVSREYQTLNMRAIRIPAASLEDLASDAAVEWLSVDEQVSFTSIASRAAANVPSGASANAAYSGLGVGVAVLDTGVASHADLDANIVQYSFLNGAYPTPTVLNGAITVLNDDPRGDGFGHGTHVAGILVGDGGDSNGAYKGTSTGATVLSLEVLNASGGGAMSDVMAALDWLSVYGAYFDIRVVNLSLGKGISESNTTDPLVIAVEKLWDAGMVVVVAAGNNGESGSMTITSPGNSRKVITVGSLTDAGTGSIYSDDYVSSFSSRGPTIGDMVLKPDLVAPGNRVVASTSANSQLAQWLPTRVKLCPLLFCSSAYLEMSGTSMATPMVAAAAALMLDKDPTLTPATVKARLMRSARKLDALPIAAGAGLLDVEAAMDDAGTITGEALSPLMVRDAATNGVLVEDTALLWGSSDWSANFLFTAGIAWTFDSSFTDSNGVTASGYMWTDSSLWANGYGWTDAGMGLTANGYGWTDEDIGAKGYGWTDVLGAKSIVENDSGAGIILQDDPSF